jgi:hypothetical protein
MPGPDKVEADRLVSSGFAKPDRCIAKSTLGALPDFTKRRDLRDSPAGLGALCVPLPRLVAETTARAGAASGARGQFVSLFPGHDRVEHCVLGFDDRGSRVIDRKRRVVFGVVGAPLGSI